MPQLARATARSYLTDLEHAILVLSLSEPLCNSASPARGPFRHEAKPQWTGRFSA